MNKQLLQRLLSGVFLVSLMAALFTLGKPALLVFALVTMLLIQRETSRLLYAESPRVIQNLNFALAAMATLLGALTHFFASIGFIFIIGVSLQVYVLQKFVKPLASTPDDLQSQISRFTYLIVYAVMIPSFGYELLKLNDGVTWFLFLLATTLGSDTCAYFIGRKFGKTPLLPSLSPKKTLEGAIGGLTGAAVISVFFAPYLSSWSAPGLLLIGAIAAAFGQIGDLVESLLKRAAGVKDSGSLIPGHGGVLDRVDGIILAAPWIYWIVSFNIRL